MDDDSENVTRQWLTPAERTLYVIDARTGEKRYKNEYEQADSERWMWWVYLAAAVGGAISGWSS